MARIKISGYLNTDDLSPEQVDLDHESGLSEQGHEEITSIFSDGPPFKISDLEDIDVVKEDD